VIILTSFFKIHILISISNSNLNFALGNIDEIIFIDAKVTESQVIVQIILSQSCFFNRLIYLSAIHELPSMLSRIHWLLNNLKPNGTITEWFIVWSIFTVFLDNFHRFITWFLKVHLRSIYFVYIKNKHATLNTDLIPLRYLLFLALFSILSRLSFIWILSGSEAFSSSFSWLPSSSSPSLDFWSGDFSCYSLRPSLSIFY